MITDAERKQLNAVAMADEVFRSLLRIRELQRYINDKRDRYADVPEFWQRIRELGISAWIEGAPNKAPETDAA